jgi:cation transporter-like permease
MNRKCIISAVVMFVMAWALSFVVHGLLLDPDYANTPGMRPPAEAQRIIYWLILAQAIFGAAFAWVYYQGKEDKPWLAQGIRFGIAVACLTVIPTYLIYHVVTPVPLVLAFKQIVLDATRVVLMGIVLAWINR